MSLNIGSALRYGLDRLVEENGLLLVVAFAVVGLLGAVASQTLTVGLGQFSDQLLSGTGEFGGAVPGVSNPDETPLALPGGVGLGIVLTLLSALVTEATRIVSDRTFVSERTSGFYEPSRRLGTSAVYGIVAGIIAGVAILIGLILLVVPGIYIGLGLYFFRQEIAVFDKGPVDALADSWSLVRGHRWSVFGLALALVVVSLVVSFGSGLLVVAAGPVVGAVVSVVVGALFATFASAVAAGAYRQLLGLERPDAPFALAMGGTQYGDIEEEWR